VSRRAATKNCEHIDALMALLYAVDELEAMKPERRSPCATYDLAVA
jgi:hypothetical protein